MSTVLTNYQKTQWSNGRCNHAASQINVLGRQARVKQMSTASGGGNQAAKSGNNTNKNSQPSNSSSGAGAPTPPPNPPGEPPHVNHALKAKIKRATEQVKPKLALFHNIKSYAKVKNNKDKKKILNTIQKLLDTNVQYFAGGDHNCACSLALKEGHYEILKLFEAKEKERTKPRAIFKNDALRKAFTHNNFKLNKFLLESPCVGKLSELFDTDYYVSSDSLITSLIAGGDIKSIEYLWDKLGGNIPHLNYLVTARCLYKKEVLNYNSLYKLEELGFDIEANLSNPIYDYSDPGSTAQALSPYTMLIRELNQDYNKECKAINLSDINLGLVETHINSYNNDSTANGGQYGYDPINPIHYQRLNIEGSYGASPEFILMLKENGAKGFPRAPQNPEEQAAMQKAIKKHLEQERVVNLNGCDIDGLYNSLPPEAYSPQYAHLINLEGAYSSTNNDRCFTRLKQAGARGLPQGGEGFGTNHRKAWRAEQY